MEENRSYFTVLAIIVVLAGAVVIESILGWETFFAVVDLLFLRVVLICFLYLLWRLVKAYEERVRIDRQRLEAERSPVMQPRANPDSTPSPVDA